MIGCLKNTNWAGKERYHFQTIDSTNIKAKELAEKGCVHGTLVTADFQDAGRGRRGRTWSSEKGTGIYMSLVLRPDLEPGNASMVTLVAAVAVAKAIGNVLEEDETVIPFIKWPNDIVLNKKKVCGILTELTLQKTKIDHMIVGIGINVSTKEFPIEIQQTASSLLLETGKDVEKEELIEAVWQQFEKYYTQFMETYDLGLIQKEYEALLINKDEKVKVLDPAGEYEGIARGITNTGELIVETGEGIKQVSSGEVSVRGLYGYV